MFSRKRVAPQTSIFGAIDYSPPTHAQLFADPIMRYGLANQGIVPPIRKDES